MFTSTEETETELRKKVTRSPLIPTPERQSPTSTTNTNKMTLSGTAEKTPIAMKTKNSRKTPPYPKKMASVKKMTPTKIKASRFTLGATRTNTMKIVKPGCVKEATMKLE